MTFRNSASFGKRQEYSVVAELLKRNYDVYMTLVDDQGIDCVVRLNDKKYLDIQIKAKSKDGKNWNFFAAMSFIPRKNYYFIFYTEKNDSFWTIPSKELKKFCVTNKTGKYKGRMSVTLPKSESGVVATRFAKYKDNKGFALLRNKII